MSLLALPGHCPLPTPTTSCAPPLMGHSWTPLLLSFFVSILLYPSFLHHSFSSFYPACCRAAAASASLLCSPLCLSFSVPSVLGDRCMAGWARTGRIWFCDVAWVRMWGAAERIMLIYTHPTALGPCLPLCVCVCSHISPFQHHTSTHALSCSPPNILLHRVASNNSSVGNICSADTQWKRAVLRIALGFYSTKAAKQTKQRVLCSLAAY